MKQLRIGFLSTAGIGRKNWKAIFNSGNCVITAVASREVEKSRKYIDECQCECSFATRPAALGSYEELLASKNVDAVYIPLPTGLRKDFVLLAAAAGKHIICEKPCAKSAAELDEMLAACRQHKVQFMDGVMFMHNPRLAKVREVLDDGQSIGQIRRMASAFSFYPGEDFFSSNIRANGALEPTGCLGDLGWYSIRFALWMLNWQLPAAVAGKILSQSEARPNRPSSPTEFSAELFYPGGVSAQFYSSSMSADKKAGCCWRISSIRSTATNPCSRSTEKRSRSPATRNVRPAPTRCNKATPPRRTRGCSAILRTRFSPAS
jgi:predicted dehydrogenase